MSYNTLVETAATTTYGYNYLSLMSTQQQQQQSFNAIYTTLIVEEAEKLYNELTTKLTNSVITSTDIRVSLLPLPSHNN